MAPIRERQASIFVDIDGTLTTTPMRAWGPVIEAHLAGVREMVKQGHEVVLWSTAGAEYVRQFCQKHALPGVVAVGKPTVVVDDDTKHGPFFRGRYAPPTFLTAPTPKISRERGDGSVRFELGAYKA